MTTEYASGRSESRSGLDGTRDPGSGVTSGESGAPAAGHEELFQRLSAEEKSALAALAHDPPRQSVPRSCAVRLLRLGLAELDCGRLLLTKAGLHAVAAISGR